MTTSQNLAVALRQFLAAQGSNGTTFPLKLFKPKEASINRWGEQRKTAMALPMVLFDLHALLQWYHWMIASGGGFKLFFLV